MNELNDIIPIIDDRVAIKILSIISRIQDPEEIADLLGLPLTTVEKKLKLIRLLELIKDGKPVESAEKLIATTANAALQKIKRGS